jgi:hypothetical protein
MHSQRRGSLRLSLYRRIDHLSMSVQRLLSLHDYRLQQPKEYAMDQRAGVTNFAPILLCLQAKTANPIFYVMVKYGGLFDESLPRWSNEVPRNQGELTSVVKRSSP